MEFTKEQTNNAKGVAICLMFAQHLYPHSNRLLNGNNYIPLIPSLNLEKHIGSFGNICVSMFLFLSGYGMFLGYLRSKKKIFNYSLIKLKDFYFTYWLYFLIFIPIGILFFKHVTFWGSNQIRYSTEPITFLKNFFGLSSTYNDEWWFVRVFLIIIIFLFPLYVKLTEKNVVFIFIVSLFLFLLSFRFKVDLYGGIFNFLFWQISFAVGIICAYLKFFSSPFIQSFDKLNWIFIFPSLLICFLIRIQFGRIYYDFLITPLFIYLSVRTVLILRLSMVFSFLGKYAFPLWLTHSFFCYYYFQDIVFFPKWSPFIFILLTAMSLLSVLVVEYLLTCMQLNSLVSTLTKRK